MTSCSVLLEWSAVGKPVNRARPRFTAWLAPEGQQGNHQQIASYLSEPRHPFACQHLCAWHARRRLRHSRADALLKTGRSRIVMAPMIKGQIAVSKSLRMETGSNPGKKAKKSSTLARQRRLDDRRLENLTPTPGEWASAEVHRVGLPPPKH